MTVWHPDTCKCIVEYDTIGGEVHGDIKTFKFIKICEIHNKIEKNVDILEAVIKRNVIKNNIIKVILTESGAEVLDGGYITLGKKEYIGCVSMADEATKIWCKTVCKWLYPDIKVKIE